MNEISHRNKILCVCGLLVMLVLFFSCGTKKEDVDASKSVDNEAVAKLEETVKAQQQLINQQQAAQQQVQQPVVQGQQESGMDMSDVILTAAATNMAMNALSNSSNNKYQPNTRVVHNTTVKKVYVPQRKASRSFFKSNRSFKSSRSFSRPSRRR